MDGHGAPVRKDCLHALKGNSFHSACEGKCCCVSASFPSTAKVLLYGGASSDSGEDPADLGPWIWSILALRKPVCVSLPQPLSVPFPTSTPSPLTPWDGEPIPQQTPPHPHTPASGWQLPGLTHQECSTAAFGQQMFRAAGAAAVPGY